METETEKKNEECYRCKFFDRYYTKEAKQYRRTKFGWCRKQVKSVNVHETCEYFIFKPPRKRCNEILSNALNDLLTQISEIRSVLEAEEDERKDL